MANKRFNDGKPIVKRRTKTDSFINQDVQDVIVAKLQDNMTVATHNMDVINEHFAEPKGTK